MKIFSSLNPLSMAREYRSLRRQVNALRASDEFRNLVYSGFWKKVPHREFSTDISCLPHISDFENPKVIHWCQQFKENVGLHRKIWEWCFISEAFESRGFLKPGKRGLGFAVGREPMPSLFAKKGCQITATDGDPKNAVKQGWNKFNEYSQNAAELNLREICPAEIFAKHVEFQFADMKQIPPSLKDYDFLWSACAIEHLGTIQKGLDFVVKSMDCLKPGGVAVHTLELNLSSRDETVDNNDFTILFRTKDLEKCAEQLRQQGHKVATLDYSIGSNQLDMTVDLSPYAFRKISDSNLPHVKIFMEGYVSSSFGLIIEKAIK